MGLLADIKKRHDALAEALGSGIAEAKPVKKKKKKRTHILDFSDSEIDAMSIEEFRKLRKD